MREKASNIIKTCHNCAKDLYPNAGKYNRDNIDWVKVTHVKKAFRNPDGLFEHMWVKILSADVNGIVGTVDNKPVLKDVPQYEEVVHVSWVEIETVAFLGGLRGC